MAGRRQVMRPSIVRGRGRGARTSTDEEWDWDNSPQPTTSPDIPFCGNLPGPKVDAVSVTDPLDCFYLFSHQTCLIMYSSNQICMQHNGVLKRMMLHHGIQSQKKTFVGMNIAMGIVS